jgi:2-phospho-L-lactate/phosphoenolpyruvate guanylyltransferase
VKTVAVIPIKTASQCKQRLASVLDARSRQQLVRFMLDRVVRAVAGTAVIDAIFLVTNDLSMVPRGAERIADPGTGLNDALTAAATQLMGQTDAMLVLPADIPLISSDDVTELVQLARSNQLADSKQMVIVPDVLRLGTNALLLAPPALVVPRFGRGSLHAHLRAALDVGVRPAVHESANIARDVDEPRDLAWLLGHSNDPRLRFLRGAPAALAG